MGNVAQPSHSTCASAERLDEGREIMSVPLHPFVLSKYPVRQDVAGSAIAQPTRVERAIIP